MIMTISLRPQDEVVRIDHQQPGQITFWVRREDKSLGSVTLMRPVWTYVKEIGFVIQEVLLSEPDSVVIAEIKKRHPDAPLPDGLRQLRLMDHEDTRISVIFTNEAPAKSCS
jgi:hypothetical protein